MKVPRFLTLRPLPIILSAVAIAIVLPSLWTGWQLDDLVQRYTLLGNPPPSGRVPSTLNQFRFLDGDTAYARTLMDEGFIPWWTLPTIRLSFWRPLSSLTHELDYALWPDSALLMHAHSLFWLGALVFVAALFYRRILGLTLAAGLAALFFALDDGHGLAAGWIANRNALVAGFFGILALILHDRWRRENWKRGIVLAPLSLLLALLAGELALGVCVYLLAYALFLDPGSVRARVVSLLPHAVVTMAWLLAYTALGFGTRGSGFYVDPFGEPLQFLAAVAWKGPLLLTDQMFFPPASFVLFLPELVPVLLVWALLILIVISALLFPLLRHEKRARFWATGLILSIPLVCTTMPHSRLLLFAGIGGFGLLAEWIAGMTQRADWLPPGKFRGVAAQWMLVALFVVHLAVAPVLLAMNSTSATFSQRYIQDAAARLEAGPGLEKQVLVIVNHPVIFYAHYFRTARFLAGQSVPRRLRVLAPGNAALRITRTDQKTLVARPEKGFIELPFDNVFRGPAHPLHVGDSVALTGVTIKVTAATPDGRPAEASFHFSVPLDDPSLRWIQWKGEGYEPFTVPAVGESLLLPPAPPLF